MLFDQVRSQVERLIPLFGLGSQAATVLTSFDELGHESLNLDVKRRAPEFSRINADGTPFQFSLSLRPERPAPLQFLGEAGRPGCRMDERLRASYTSLAGLARACRLIDEVDRILPALRDLTPEDDPHLIADASGMFWFALSFLPGAAPSLTIYINGRWGADAARWQRLDRFAASFDATEGWRALAERAMPGLAPLGMAITLRSNTPPSGRIYLQAFGVDLRVYRDLYRHSAATPGAIEAFDGFARDLLGDDVQYPTRSAVFSIELPAAGVKFELCAHCAFADDCEAATRISRWLQQAGIGDGIYRSMVSSLTLGRPLAGGALPALHAYVGVGTHGSDHYASVYFNPGPTLELA